MVRKSGYRAQAIAVNAFALHDVTDQATARRWGASAFAIVAAHAALIALALNWYHPAAGARRFPSGDHGRHGAGFVRAPADAGGPRAGTGDATGRRLAARARGGGSRAGRDRTDPAAGKAGSRRAAGAEGGNEAGEAEPAKPVPEAKPTPVKPKVVRADAKKPTDAPPAPRTTASPKAERQAPPASTASIGASAAAMASYRQMVAAHLQRFKQYPPAAKSAGQQGTSRVSFTLSRSGGVLSVSLGGSSGHSQLDAETVAMVRRAQPFPAFPEDIKQSSMPFNAPVAFYIR